MNKLILFILTCLLLVNLSPSFAEEEIDLDDEDVVEKIVVQKPVSQTISLINKLENKDVLKIIGILEDFELLDLSINIKEREIHLKYRPNQVNLATIIHLLTVLDYKIISVRQD